MTEEEDEKNFNSIKVQLKPLHRDYISPSAT